MRENCSILRAEVEEGHEESFKIHVFELRLIILLLLKEITASVNCLMLQVG